ncbi:hypothetical protein HYQ46_004950 [Verticillium longisporum]|nr:hypothetical protein HYQ46_004950 [Verticillium longisporum]
MRSLRSFLTAFGGVRGGLSPSRSAMAGRCSRGGARMVRGKFWPFTGARSSSRQLPNAIRVRAIPVATSQETWETPREYRGGAAERPRNPQGYVDQTCFLAHLSTS